MDKRLEIYFDENLRDVPRDPDGFGHYVVEIEASLKEVANPQQQVRLLGELGHHLRVLGDLQKAEQLLRKALQIVHDHKLGLQWEVQQKIRLAHVLQWKREFKASDRLFSEVIAVCRSNSDVDMYLAFALQHAGKNLFDQNKFREALELFEEAMNIRLERRAPQDQIESTELAIKRIKSLLAD